MRTTTATAAALLALAVPTAARAEKLTFDEDTNLTLSALLQPQALVAEAAAPDGGPGTDFFVRRARLVLGGQLTSRVSFFVDTEQANLGKDGDWTTSIFLQDAFVSLVLVPDVVTVDAGMMLIPFTRHNLQSAASLNGLDYHAKLILFPSGSNRVWRDVGLQGRADLGGGRVHLRAGVYNGAEGTPADETMATPSRNAADLPRVAGHARVDLLGHESGFFYPGITFATEPVLSVGVGADWQADVIMNADGARDHLGLAADVYAELPTFYDQAVVAQATFVRYDDGDGATTTGLGFFAEAGYRIGWIEPIAAVEVFRADAAADAGDFTGLHLGAAAFIDKHRTNVKLDVARSRAGDADPIVSAALQAQLFF